MSHALTKKNSSSEANNFWRVYIHNSMDPGILSWLFQSVQIVVLSYLEGGHYLNGNCIGIVIAKFASYFSTSESN